LCVCCELGVFLEAARKKVERRGRDGGFGGLVSFGLSDVI
jgi:hypothetical protein